MKKVLLMSMAISCIAQGMEHDQNSSNLRKRTVLSQSELGRKKWSAISYVELVEKNKKREAEWAKISRLTHLKEAMLESKVVVAIGLSEFLFAAIAYVIYSTIKQA